MELNLRLREARKRTGLSGHDVAQILGFSAQHYYDMEAGRKRLYAEVLVKFGFPGGGGPYVVATQRAYHRRGR